MILGNNVRLATYSDGAWVQVAGERACTLKVSADYAESSKGRGKAYTVQLRTWSVEGKALLPDTAALAAWWNRTGTAAELWRVKRSGKAWQGRAFLSKLSFSAKTGGAVEISFTLQGSGKLEEVAL